MLVLGIENDGTITGHNLPSDAVAAVLDTPAQRLSPAQAKGFRIQHGDFELLVFDVPAADGPVMVEGDGFPLRMGDRTVAASESQIKALKLRGLVESWESRPSPMRIDALDRFAQHLGKRNLQEQVRMPEGATGGSCPRIGGSCPRIGRGWRRNLIRIGGGSVRIGRGCPAISRPSSKTSGRGPERRRCATRSCA